MATNTDSWVASRLKSARAAAGMSLRDVADVLGCARATVHAWETGRNQPNLETIAALAELYDKPISYLADPEYTDDAGRYIHEPALPYSIPSPPRRPSAPPTPEYLDRDAHLRDLGCPIPRSSAAHNLVDDQAGEDDIHALSALADPTCHILRVTVDSMAPTIVPGDIIIIARDAQATDDDIVAARIRLDGQWRTVLKRYHHVAGETIVLSSDNLNYPPIVVDHMRTLGVVLELLRPLKRPCPS